MEVRFVVEKGGRKRILYMREPQAVVGRAKGNTVRIPSPDVSRQHCRLRVVDGVLEVEDLDSVNGTFLNGGKVNGWQAVRPGDKLEVGPVKFVIEYELTPKALERLKKKAPPAHAGVSVLQGLADGSVVDADAIDDLEIIDQPLEEAEALPMLELADEEAPVSTPEDVDMIRPDFNIDDDDLQMPDGSEFRDLLSQMDDDLK